ncbi:16S rRNA (uracil(1498)-N(3))-methyltransferase [Geobacter pickeringii]|uniref:Ribosomal RNA small subunit methyltransferase E n=1 Tax=Geobacter pickeringii TaxID=345632 RepID=A0A0B5BHC4_9BACT|nr:16S rRNA (uracil(1498)-N(3))-methyltransferase [Geobacter pickeringii]AJE04584.1 16S rRNA methyltransferase [Geobacter pickeringii]
MRRFILPGADLSGEAVEVRGDLFRHMAKVLRLKIDTSVQLADGCGIECSGVIREIGRESLLVAIMQRRATAPPAAAPRITLYQGLPKGDKMELILQKCTELGVSEVVPFPAVRSVSRVAREREAEKLRRWQRVAEEASRQAGRPLVPTVRYAADGMKGVAAEADHDLRLLLWEGEQITGLRETLSARPLPASIAVIVGPEGGITPEEAELAREKGFIPVTLGQRILRTETAGIALVAILQYLFGDLGGAGPTT